MRWAVCGLRRAGLLKANDTAALLTPASRATSAIRARGEGTSDKGLLRAPVSARPHDGSGFWHVVAQPVYKTGLREPKAAPITMSRANQPGARIAAMLEQLRQMPNGVRLLLGFGLCLLAIVAVTLPLIVEQAVEAPVSPLGLLWMLLLAYVIFTLTLILQRKQAG